MEEFPECEGLNAHRRRICRGERTDLSRAEVNRLRISWGLAALEAPVSDETSNPATVDADQQKSPSVFQKAVTFTRALAVHAWTGMAKCSEAEIEARLKICKDCPAFTGTHCRECGCSCSSNQRFFNKLAWQTERCPLDHW
jgi:hypothetical protein